VNFKNINIPFQVDLSNCDQELIHIPGSIQPHGVILALKYPELNIVQISSNSLEILDISHTELLNQSLNKIFDIDQLISYKIVLFKKNYYL
jgi:light-regulated signal transduction histidine kinase (bacteriophytochrome)